MEARLAEYLTYKGPQPVDIGGTNLESVEVSASTPLPVAAPNPDGTTGDQVFALLGSTATPVAANATGPWVGPLARGAYAFRAEGAFGGGTVTLNFRGLDGATPQAFSPAASMTSASTVIVNIGSGAYVQATLSGATGASIRANIS